MKRSLPVLLALALVTGCALSPSSSDRALRTVDRAVDALGGEAALSSLKSVAIRGEDRSFESESRFLVQRDLEKRAARVDWDRTVLRAPKPMPLKFSEMQGVKRHGLDPERFAAGHGSTGYFAELARFVGQ